MNKLIDVQQRNNYSNQTVHVIIKETRRVQSKSVFFMLNTNFTDKHENIATFSVPSPGDVITLTVSSRRRRSQAAALCVCDVDFRAEIFRFETLCLVRVRQWAEDTSTPTPTRKQHANPPGELLLRGTCLRAPGAETRTRNRGEASMITSSRWANMLTTQLTCLLISWLTSWRDADVT